MRSFPGLVIGTAGHIDHGKTSLVRALTGVDTDRLAEEKKRGISIDLGFAHLTLADGRQISFIDVPGHERFVKNMVAGAAGVEAILLVVAANDSVKPQTREHFDICRLLGIRDGIIVLTKIDLASPEQRSAACEDIRKLCAGSFLDNAPIVEVSAITGEGLGTLKQTLAELGQRLKPRNDAGLLRLPVDRSFALKGFGTVVTGTMWNGTLGTGETVEIHPGKRKARVRGLQVHGQPVSMARAGQRTAVNLTGVDHSEVRRGFMLTAPAAFEPRKMIDVAIDWLPEAGIPAKRKQVLFHAGTAEVPALLKVLDRGEHHSSSLARLWLAQPVLVLPGDRFVLRSPSPLETVAGGSVIDAFPPARLSRGKTIARLKALSEADIPTRLEILVEESAKGRMVAGLARSTGLGEEMVKSLVGNSAKLAFIESAQSVVSRRWIAREREKVVAWLREFHRNNPAAAGAPIAQARLNLEPQLATAVFQDFAAVRIQGDLVALAEHKPTISATEAQALSNIENAFRKAGFQPAAPLEILRTASADVKTARGLLEALIKSQKLVRVSEDLVFHSDVVSHIRKSLAPHKGRKFSVPEFKEWTHVSRKYAIPLLEYLDRQHV
ncbi:MAG: selenocysteine-specific translation elongation factor, partial [Acidobacteriaceae bacterium]|nr:selenocysteine-specific translation elongation factor [Acidobacteriaceae bacterium]